MKMSKSLFIAMAVAVAAWAQDEVAPQVSSPIPEAEPVAPAKTVRAKKVRPPHEHRGFFFSMGMGVSYLSSSVDESNVSYSTGGGYLDTDGSFIPQSKYEHERVLHEEFSGWGAPVIEFRFGKSICNMVMEAFGLGLSIYPFRNPESMLNGLYIGVSGGVEAFDSHLDDSFSIISNGGVYTRFELGKDWWVSDTWSLGVGIAYVNVTVFEDGNDKEEHERNSISFFIRLTHG